MSLFFFQRRASTPKSSYFSSNGIPSTRSVLTDVYDLDGNLTTVMPVLCISGILGGNNYIYARYDRLRMSATKSWKVKFYTGYDPATKTFSGLAWEANGVNTLKSGAYGFGIAHASSNTPDVSAMYPAGVNPFQDPPTDDYFIEIVETPTNSTTTRNATGGGTNYLDDTASSPYSVQFHSWVEVGDKVTITNPDRVCTVTYAMDGHLDFAETGDLITASSSYVVELKQRKSFQYYGTTKWPCYRRWDVTIAGGMNISATEARIYGLSLTKSICPEGTKLIISNTVTGNTNPISTGYGIPDWPGIGAKAYTTVIEFESGLWPSIGGAARFSRKMEDWYVFDGANWVIASDYEAGSIKVWDVTLKENYNGVVRSGSSTFDNDLLHP